MSFGGSFNDVLRKVTFAFCSTTNKEIRLNAKTLTRTGSSYDDTGQHEKRGIVERLNQRDLHVRQWLTFSVAEPLGTAEERLAKGRVRTVRATSLGDVHLDCA